MREKRGLLSFFVLRKIERALPVEILYWILRPEAFVRAAFRYSFQKAPPPIVLPGCFHPAGTIRTARLRRMSIYLNRTLQSFPDQLGKTKWLNRCRLVGIDHIRQARQNKRPIILAFCHFGPIHLLRFWLRAAGIPAAVLVSGKLLKPSLLKRLRDRHSPFPEIPTIFFLHQLREAVEFLSAGNPLVMAVDYPSGRQMSVPLRDGWNFQMATGAIRLAIRHRAELVPCCIIDEGRWRFRIELGRPVPAEHLAAETNLIPAGKHLLDELLVHFQAHPEQCSKYLIANFKHIPFQQNSQRSNMAA